MTDKIALIIGGSRGLGRNTALHLARAGVGIVLTYNSQAAEAEDAVAEIEAAGGEAATLQLDTGDTGQFDDFATRLADTLEQRWGSTAFD